MGQKMASDCTLSRTNATLAVEKCLAEVGWYVRPVPQPEMRRLLNAATVAALPNQLAGDCFAAARARRG
jgi:hypothetical protein